MLLNGRRLSESATDTAVVPIHTSADQAKQLKTNSLKNPQVLVPLKGLYLVATSIIFLNFYYQIIVSGIQDMELIQNDSQQVAMSEEGIQILHLKGILSLGLLEREFDFRNNNQHWIGREN